jgi:hypothetical protein
MGFSLGWIPAFAGMTGGIDGDALHQALSAD